MTRMLAIAAVVASAALSAAATPALAQQDYQWTNSVPDSLRGTWVVQGQKCDDENSRLAIFSDGGYRWRKARTDWGFARGKFSYDSDDAANVYFLLQRLVPNEEPDFQITVSGTEMRKYSFGSGETQRYDRCP